MLPLLKLAGDKKEHKLSAAVESLSKEFSLTESECRELCPSQAQTVIFNRVTWAKTYLKKAGLLEDVRKGVFLITDRGLKVLSENPEKITSKYLKQFEGFCDFYNHNTKKEDKDPHLFQSEDLRKSESTPDDLLDEGYAKLTETLAGDLLSAVKNSSPKFFENLVIDLLVHMGYGGNFEEAAQVVGKTGDEGIDGIIKEDRLGLDSIYVQAKRWNTSVGRPEIQKFAGALFGKNASKGVFITTGSFSKEALEYAESIKIKIVLIDGAKLANLMIEYNVGVSTKRILEIKKLDSDYFEEQV